MRLVKVIKRLGFPVILLILSLCIFFSRKYNQNSDNVYWDSKWVFKCGGVSSKSIVNWSSEKLICDYYSVKNGNDRIFFSRNERSNRVFTETNLFY